jgi:hypothetical protein
MVSQSRKNKSYEVLVRSKAHAPNIKTHTTILKLKALNILYFKNNAEMLSWKR